MTDAEIQAAIAAQVAPIRTANEALVASNKELSDQLRSFTETSARKTEAHAFCEKLKGDKKYLGKIPTEMLEDILSDATIPAPVATKVKAFAAALPAFLIPGDVAGKKKAAGADGDDADDDEGGDADEPAAVAKVRMKHFAQRDDANAQQIIDAGLTAFSEFKLDAFKGIENDPETQIRKLQAYVKTRDTATN